MPPSRPSKDEINFTRLLRACEQLASEADGNLLNSTHYAPFKQYLDDLRRRLAGLERLQKEMDPSLILDKHIQPPTRETLNEYKRKVDYLSELIDPRLATRDDASLTNMAVAHNPHLRPEEKRLEISLRSRARRSAQNEMRARLLHSTEVSASSAADESRASLLSSASSQSGADPMVEALLSHHQSLQDQYSDELVHIAARLKQNAKSVQSLLHNDLQSLNKLSTEADANLVRADTANGSLQQLMRVASGTTMSTLLVLVAATLGFVFVYIFMKIVPKPSP
jgi:hypothetical protein